MENSKNASLSKLVPVMLCFFAMGFVDLVGIEPDGFSGKYLPFIGVLLVPYFLCADGHVDEPYRS